MTAQDAQNHIEDIKQEISWLLFHSETLKRKMELLEPKVRSNIVKPTKITNFSRITEKDIEVDVVPIGLATMEIVKVREEYYMAMIELANVQVAIIAKKEILRTYIDHIKDGLEKQAKPCSDTMIYDAYHKAKDLKNLSPEEKTILESIGENLLVTVNGGKEKRIELYDLLQNLIKQHGI